MDRPLLPARGEGEPCTHYPQHPAAAPSIPMLLPELGHATSFDTEMWRTLLSSDHEGDDHMHAVAAGAELQHHHQQPAGPDSLMVHRSLASLDVLGEGIDEDMAEEQPNSTGSPARPLVVMDPAAHARLQSVGSGSPCSGATTAGDGEAGTEDACGSDNTGFAAATGQGTTRLRGGGAVITQAEFLTVIQEGEGKDAGDLFDFRWPEKRGKDKETAKEKAQQRQSAILTLTTKQHGVMYALAGCSDVVFAMSKVSWPVRQAIKDLYDIDKLQFSTWFKNRRPPLKRRLAREGQTWVPARPRRSSGAHPAPQASTRSQRRHTEDAVAVVQMETPLMSQAGAGASSAPLEMQGELPVFLPDFEESPAESGAQIPQLFQAQAQHPQHQMWWQQAEGAAGHGMLDMPARPPRPSARLTERLAQMHHQRMLQQQQQQQQQEQHQELQLRMSQRASANCEDLQRSELVSHVKTESPAGMRHRISEPVFLAMHSGPGQGQGLDQGGLTVNSAPPMHRSRSLFNPQAGPTSSELSTLQGDAMQQDIPGGPRPSSRLSWRPEGAAQEDSEEDEPPRKALAVPSARLAERLALLQQRRWPTADQDLNQQQQQTPPMSADSNSSLGSSSRLPQLSSRHASDLGVRRAPLKYRHSEPTGLGLGLYGFQSSRLMHSSTATGHNDGVQTMAQPLPPRASLPGLTLSLAARMGALGAGGGGEGEQQTLQHLHDLMQAQAQEGALGGGEGGGWGPGMAHYAEQELQQQLRDATLLRGMPDVPLGMQHQQPQQQQHRRTLDWVPGQMQMQQMRQAEFMDVPQGQLVQVQLQDGSVQWQPHQLVQRQLMRQQGTWSSEGGAAAAMGASGGGDAHLDAQLPPRQGWGGGGGGGFDGGDLPPYRHSASGMTPRWAPGGSGETYHTRMAGVVALNAPALARGRSSALRPMPTLSEASEPQTKPGAQPTFGQPVANRLWASHDDQSSNALGTPSCGAAAAVGRASGETSSSNGSDLCLQGIQDQGFGIGLPPVQPPDSPLIYTTNLWA